MHASPRLRAALLERRRRPGVAGAGAPRPRRADGYEFAELREYVAGDDPRRIDWAATARAGTLQTRVMYEDHALVLAAALDRSPSMFVGRDRSVADLAADALAVWYGLAAADDRCMRVVGDAVLADARRRGRSAAHLCAEPREAPGGAFAATLRATLAAVPRDASLLVVSDFYELEDLLVLLRMLSARCDVTALIARDPWYDRLPLGGFVRLRDAESGAAHRLFIGRRERERFAAAVAARERGVRQTLEAVGIRTGVLATDPERALAEAFGLA
jgi:uncharacterized protein (DUF58 family)